MQLTYLLEWESLAERETKWTKFSNDPTWLAGRAESEKNGPLIANVESSILQPARFSSVH
jgi:NIPSNAP